MSNRSDLVRTVEHPYGVARLADLLREGTSLRRRLAPNRPALDAIETNRARWREQVAHALAHVDDGGHHLETFQKSLDGALPDAFGLRQKAVSAQLDTDLELLRTIVDRCTSSRSNKDAADGGVFLVHGRAELDKFKVQQFLTQVLSHPPIVIDQLAGGSLPLIEKFERFAGMSSIAVVLVTGDDEGRLIDPNDRSLRRRARQNVIFELGYFRARLGASRVIVLKADDVEFPSDLGGVCYVSLSADWRIGLIGELKSCGATVHLERLVGP